MVDPRHRTPLRLGGEYEIREWVADKGRSGRTVYLTYEFDVLAGAQTAQGEVARGRLICPDGP